MLHANCCPRRDVYLQRLDKQIFLTMRVLKVVCTLGIMQTCKTATFPPIKYATETTIRAAGRKSPKQPGFLCDHIEKAVFRLHRAVPPGDSCLREHTKEVCSSHTAKIESCA